MGLGRERITSRQRWTQNSEVGAEGEERQKLKGRVKNRERKQIREKGEKDTQRETERDKEKVTRSLRPSISSPQSHPCIPKAARELRERRPGSCGGTHRSGAPTTFLPFRGCPLAPGARSPAIAGLAQCAPLTASLPALLARLWESSWERRTGDGGAGGGRSWERAGGGMRQRKRLFRS